MGGNLKEKAVSGILWSAVQKFGSIALSFISTIVLARLLTPEDYGYIGMLAIFLAVASTFIDGGFGSALIQKKRPTKEDYSTIFYWNLGLSIVLYTVLFFCAPVIASFYDLPLLSSILRVQGIVLIVNAVRIVQINQLRKQLKFKKIASVDLSVAAVSLAVTIYLAWKGYGVWALVVQQLMVSVLTTALYWITSRWRPLLVFSKQSFKQLFNFGFFILLSNLVNTISNNIQGLLIGKFYSPATMGYYSKARSTEELSANFISSIINQVSYPVLAEAQHNKTYMIRMLKEFIETLAYITFPLMILLMLLAKPIFLLLYSERWLPSVPYFQLLCLAGIASCLQGINYNAVAAIGRSRDVFIWTMIKRGIGLIFVVVGLLVYGIYGLIIGSVITSWFIYIVNAWLVQKYIGYTLKQQFKDLLPILLISFVSGLVTFSISFFRLKGVYLNGLIQFFAFCSFYIILSVLFKLEAFNSAKETLQIVLEKVKNRK